MDDELKNKIIDAFNETDWTLQQIADNLGSTYKVVWSVVAKNFTEEERHERKCKNYSRSKSGENNQNWGLFREQHPNWKGDVADGKGYIIVLRPDWFTGRKGSKHVFKHTIVMCEALGVTELPAGFCIHHIDGDKTNNDINNLALMTQTAHQRLHSRLKRATTISKESREEEPLEAHDNR